MRVVNLTSMPKRKPDLQTGNLSNQQRLAIVHYKDKHPDVSYNADGTVTAVTAAIEEIRKAQRNLRWKIREERLAKGRENGVQLKIFHFMRVDS